MLQVDSCWLSSCLHIITNKNAIYISDGTKANQNYLWNRKDNFQISLLKLKRKLDYYGGILIFPSCLRQHFLDAIRVSGSCIVNAIVNAFMREVFYKHQLTIFSIPVPVKCCLIQHLKLVIRILSSLH